MFVLFQIAFFSLMRLRLCLVFLLIAFVKVIKDFQDGFSDQRMDAQRFVVYSHLGCCWSSPSEDAFVMFASSCLKHFNNLIDLIEKLIITVG